MRFLKFPFLSLLLFLDAVNRIISPSSSSSSSSSSVRPVSTLYVTSSHTLKHSIKIIPRKMLNTPLQEKQQDDDDGDDDGILLRRYQPEDHPMICEIFRRGIESNSAAAWRSVCSSPNVMAIMLSLGSLVGGGVWWLATHTIKSRTNTTTGAVQRQQALGLALGSSALTVMGLMAMIWVKMAERFRSYVEHSLEEDLQSPQELLKVYGGKGAVVVAVDKSTNKVVGMVAGQEMKNEESLSAATEGIHSNNNGGIFELRRMSVDTRIQRRGIGKRLIRQLEKELPQDKQKIILTCSSIQYAAHHLYEKVGFTLCETMTFSNRSWLFRQGVCFRRYEKDFWKENK